MAERPGVPNLIRSDWARNLNRIFPQERGGFDLPNVLTGHVQLTHDALGTIANAAVTIYDLLGAADSTSIVQAVPVPTDFIWIVDSIAVTTDDTATRVLTLFLHYINSAGDFSMPLWSQDSGVVVSRWWGFPYGRFIIPPAGKLELTASALTAGKKIRFTLAALQVPLGQFSPRS